MQGPGCISVSVTGNIIGRLDCSVIVDDAMAVSPEGSPGNVSDNRPNDNYMQSFWMPMFAVTYLFAVKPRPNQIMVVLVVVEAQRRRSFVKIISTSLSVVFRLPNRESPSSHFTLFSSLCYTFLYPTLPSP